MLELALGVVSLTSGKVPLEKTLRNDQHDDDNNEKASRGGTERRQFHRRAHCRRRQSRQVGWVQLDGYLHQQAGLTASTVANDDQLASNLGHVADGYLVVVGYWGDEERVR